MKKIIPVLIIIMALMSKAKAQDTSAITQASQIAQKMKDSLSLSDQQKSQIEAVTIGLQDLRANLHQLYTGRALNYYLLMAEDNRDTLYKNILPPEKYLLFRQKKANLFNNN